MSTEPREQTLAELSHEQIEWHIHRAHELRNEALVSLIHDAAQVIRNAFARVRRFVTDRTQVMTSGQPTG